MAAQTTPIFSRTPDVQWIESVVTANNTLDLTSGTSYLVFTADATEGGWVEELRVKANPANNTAATVARFWLNNGSTLGTSSNSALIGEVSLTATVAAAGVANPDFSYLLRRAIPAGYRIYATVGTAPGGSGEFTVTAFGGKY
jgi:hypothetical protein